MKIGQLEQNGKAVHEFLMHLDHKEVIIIVDALEAYAKANPRKKTIKKLYDELDNSNILVF